MLEQASTNYKSWLMSFRSFQAHQSFKRPVMTPYLIEQPVFCFPQDWCIRCCVSLDFYQGHPIRNATNLDALVNRHTSTKKKKKKKMKSIVWWYLPKNQKQRKQNKTID